MDDSLLAVDKPSGLPMHRGWARAPQYLDRLLADQLHRDVFLVHRLDQGTSGVVLLALSPDAANAMHQLFNQRCVHKRYLALVRGEPPACGLVDYAIPRAPGKERVSAQTAFRTLATVETQPRAMALVEAAPTTGRLHQVRRHLKHLRHPVVNDANHGDNRFNRAVQAFHGLTRLALHAAAIRFEHPITGVPVTVSAPLPDDLAGPLRHMGFDATLWSEPQRLLDDPWPDSLAAQVTGV
ncbi:MAG: pseudouridine synthase [Pseudomonadota bacterium]